MLVKKSDLFFPITLIGNSQGNSSKVSVVWEFEDFSVFMEYKISSIILKSSDRELISEPEFHAVDGAFEKTGFFYIGSRVQIGASNNFVIQADFQNTYR